MLTTLIADDHALTAQGIRTLLEREVAARVCAHCEHGAAVVPAVDTHSPDLIVLDLGLPDLSGLDVLPDVVVPGRTVVIYTGYDDAAYVTRALQGGADAFVLKGDDPSCLVEAVHHAQRGASYLSPSLSPQRASLTNEALTNNEAPAPKPRRYDRLTRREREVFHLVARGHTSAQIGDLLFISKRTVDKHRQNLMAKLGVHSASEIIRLAYQWDMLPEA